MFANILADEKPTHVAVAFDIGRKTFRTERFPEYKAQRESAPEEFKGQVPILSLIHISEPTIPVCSSRMPSSA